MESYFVVGTFIFMVIQNKLSMVFMTSQIFVVLMIVMMWRLGLPSWYFLLLFSFNIWEESFYTRFNLVGEIFSWCTGIYLILSILKLLASSSCSICYKPSFLLFTKISSVSIIWAEFWNRGRAWILDSIWRSEIENILQIRKWEGAWGV